MNLMDTLKPQSFTPTGHKQEEKDKDLAKQIWKSRHRRLKESVERARKKLNQAEKALEEFLNA